MTRTTTAGMTTHLAGRAHTRCRLLLLVLQDGTSVGITDHDKHIEHNLIGAGTIEYRADTGATMSDISLQAGLDADNCEITGPLKDEGDFTLERVVGGRFHRARVYIADINWKTPSDGTLKLLAGNVTEVRVEGSRFIFEMRSDFDRYNQIVGRLITNNCDADFGDARCGATPQTVVGTVTAVTDAMTFTVSYSGSFADDFFNAGTVQFLTGALAGTAVVEIFDWTVGGALTLWLPAVEAPAIGDTLNIFQGCGKSRADCMARNNILNFRGFPEVPGSDAIMKAAIPGQGNG